MTAEEFIKEWLDESTPTVEVRTSGSTGTPKVMSVEKSRMRASARTTCAFLGLKPGETALLCMSPDYIAGKMMIVRAYECGLRLKSVNPSNHPLACVDSDFDFVAMVPMQVYCALQEPLERERLMRVRHLIIGGGAIDKDLEEALCGFPNAVWSTYGMTETLSHIALRRISGPEASQWYTPFGGVEVGVDDYGCLTIYAPEICPDPLVTRDIVEMNADGRRFRVIGRRDNVICSGGVKIQIEEVEALLKPYIKSDFMITKASDKKFGEICVLLFTGQANVAEACSTLPKYFQPKRMFKVSELPLTPTGKPARARAEEMAEKLVNGIGNTQ